MPNIQVNGCNIAYEEMGSGPPLVLNSGGRNDRNQLRDLAGWLAEDHRVIIYDRRNTGASDLAIADAPSEFHLWADDLHEMLIRLNATPALVGGGSNGCRTSLLLAIRHPESVRALLLWNVANYSTPTAAERLGQPYYGEPIEAAKKGGMPAVAALPQFAERVQQDPAKRDRLMRMDPKEFIGVMERWQAGMLVPPPGLGPTPAEISSIRASAVIIGGNDPIHPRTAAEALHGLLRDSELYPYQLTPEEVTAITDQEKRAAVMRQRNYPILRKFLAKVEGRAPAQGFAR